MRLSRYRQSMFATMALVALSGALASCHQPAHAATVTITPPSYTITPPKFTFTLPDSIGGKQGIPGVKGDPGPAGAGITPDDLSALIARMGNAEAAIKALQAAPAVATGSAPASTSSVWVLPSVDPCAALNGGKWDKLTIDPTMNIAAALQCGNVGGKLTLSAGFYAQVAHVPSNMNFDIGGVSAASVFVSGRGGCTVANNNSGNCNTKLAYRKGVFHVDSPITIHDMTVAYGGFNANDGHDGQAGIYLDNGSPGMVTLTNILFYQNQNGIFANTNTQLGLTVNTSDFKLNGVDGGSHSSYISGGPGVTYNNIHDYGSNSGNDQKGRTGTVVINGGWFKSIEGRWIEAADGANMTINGGDFVGNNCCQNMFGNGTESTSKGTGNTVWHGPSRIWIQRDTDFANAGTFNADANVIVYVCGGSVFNDKGGSLNGWTIKGCDVPIPSDPPFISGAVNLPPAM